MVEKVAVTTDEIAGDHIDGNGDDECPQVAYTFHTADDIKTEQTQHRVGKEKPHLGIVRDIPGQQVQ